VLRRDPSVYAKLSVITHCEDLLREQELTEVKQLQATSRRPVENKFRSVFPYTLGWKTSLAELVGPSKIVPSGLGRVDTSLVREVSAARGDKSLGARLSSKAP